MTNPQTKPETVPPRYRAPERQPWHRRLRWGDFMVTVIVAVLAAALLLSAPRGLAGQSQIALLTEDGRTVFSKPTAELQSGGSFTFEAQGYHYTFTYENGRIRFAQADCPDQVCVRTGWVARAGQVAACVPGHLILKMSGPAKPGDDIDIIMQ